MGKAVRTYNKRPIGRGDRVYAAALFGLLWVLLFCVYFPAARAGFVTDFTGWLEQVRSQGFWDFINRTHFQAKSLYQLTQFNTYVLYKLLGTSAWLWHLLFITLHTVNAYLLFVFSKDLLEDAGEKQGRMIASIGALLFCLSPYISEVIIWEPAFHFLQGLLLILLILRCVQLYVHTDKVKYLVVAGVLYFLSLFSLEVFYVTPLLVLSLGVFYSKVPRVKTDTFRRVAVSLFGPMLLMLVTRFVCYRLLYGDWVSRIGAKTVGHITFESFGKPAKYLFHLVVAGRFFPDDLRKTVYDVCDSTAGILVFYGLIIAMAVLIFRLYARMSGAARVASLLFTWLGMCLLLLVPLWFQSDMLVCFDRYIYFAAAFFYMLLAVLISFITVVYIRLSVLGFFALLNLRFAIQVSRYWGKSYAVVRSLLEGIPAERNKTMILLNLPMNMHGVPMIGAEKNSEYKLMHDLLLPEHPLTNTVYDVLAYNMQTPTDGAYVNVMNDSLVKVTLKQWGTWWWFETRGGWSYENSDYKLNLIDPGHWYELTLKKPADQYILLFSSGGEWRRVDMSKKETAQY